MVKPVGDEPEVTVFAWGIVLDPLGYRLAGYRVDDQRGRITSPLVELDMTARTAVTESGRVYTLRGDPDPDAAAEIAKAHMRRAGLTAADVALVDVEDVVLAFAPKPTGPWN